MASESQNQKSIMKPTKFIILGVLLGTGLSVTAQDKPKREVPPVLLEKFDTDKDGKLSDDERKAMRAEMKAQQEKRQAAMLEKYDADKDGKLSDTEKATMKTDMEAKRAAMLEKYDANKSGKLEPEEIKAARAAGEEIPPPVMGHGPGGKRGKRGPGPGGPPPAPAAE
jgi:Ca2+-binding EF-hand superfamily protein